MKRWHIKNWPTLEDVAIVVVLILVAALFVLVGMLIGQYLLLVTKYANTPIDELPTWAWLLMGGRR